MVDWPASVARKQLSTVSEQECCFWPEIFEQAASPAARQEAPCVARVPNGVTAAPIFCFSVVCALNLFVVSEKLWVYAGLVAGASRRTHGMGRSARRANVGFELVALGVVPRRGGGTHPPASRRPRGRANVGTPGSR
jgi:hypothetical protein